MVLTPSERIESVRAIVNSLLPPNATRLERAMMAADLAAVSEADPESIPKIWSPMECPEALLPWLAWALSVDVWDAGWTEERKRRVIAASPLVHRLKGTAGAVRRALDAFDIDASIVEWWQEVPTGRRGTFRVDMRYRDKGPAFHGLTQAQAMQAVRAAKPKSRVFVGRALIEASAPLTLSASSRSNFLAVAQPYAFGGAVVAATAFLGACAASLFTATVLPKAN